MRKVRQRLSIPTIAALGTLAIVTAAIAQGPVGPVTNPTQTTSRPRPRLDVVFAIDATGSMGDEIDQVKTHLWRTANQVMAGQPRPDVRFGLVIYRDRTDAEHTRVVPLTRDVDAIHRELMGIVANGGGDGPEDVDAALELSVRQINWDTSAAHMVFLIGDAPPKPYGLDRGAILEEARRREITFHTVQASGMDAVGARVFEEIAGRTGGVAEVLTYTRDVTYAGTSRVLMNRGADAWISSRSLSDEERGLSFEELRRRRLVERAPAAVTARPAPRAAGAYAVEGRASGAAPAVAAPADSDIGGIITREAREAAEERGVAY